jgi:hypothetical protein
MSGMSAISASIPGPTDGLGASAQKPASSSAGPHSVSPLEHAQAPGWEGCQPSTQNRQDDAGGDGRCKNGHRRAVARDESKHWHRCESLVVHGGQIWKRSHSTGSPLPSLRVTSGRGPRFEDRQAAVIVLIPVHHPCGERRRVQTWRPSPITSAVRRLVLRPPHCFFPHRWLPVEAGRLSDAGLVRRHRRLISRDGNRQRGLRRRPRSLRACPSTLHCVQRVRAQSCKNGTRYPEWFACAAIAVHPVSDRVCRPPCDRYFGYALAGSHAEDDRA